MSKERIGSIKDHTPNFKIIIPRFDLATWHDYIEENFRNIDALFFNLFGINNYSGSWKQITEYKQGQVLFIGDDLDINGNVTEFSGRLVKVLVDHVTDNSDYFNVFYNLHPEYYELFADASTAQIYAQQAQSYKNETETLKNEADLIKSDVITKQNEINDTISAFTDDFSIKTEEIMQKVEEGKVIIAQKTAISTENVEKSRIWAEGEQEEVETLGGTLSSRGHADLAMAIANADEDVPIDASGLIALDVIKGEKGDPGKDFYDGYITNCITEIPQDIKLELNNGTLTLKAGSKVYVPNGVGKFDKVVISADEIIGQNGTVSGAFAFYRSDVNKCYSVASHHIYSGATAPSDTALTATWYDTTNKVIKVYDGSKWISNVAFPLCRFTNNNSSVTSIDQVFNGFGYIGSTVFALPGVKGLIPNGRNADGSLKNIEFTVSKVLTTTRAGTNNYLYIDKNLHFFNTNVVTYDQNDNYNLSSIGDRYCCEVGFIDGVSGAITSFNPKLPFRAIDRNDSSWIAQQAMPSGKHISLTPGASEATYTAPANGYFTFSVKSSSTNVAYATGAILSSDSEVALIRSHIWIPSNVSGNYTRGFLPCKKGQRLFLGYYNTTIDYLQFTYAEGE